MSGDSRRVVSRSEWPLSVSAAAAASATSHSMIDWWMKVNVPPLLAA